SQEWGTGNGDFHLALPTPYSYHPTTNHQPLFTDKPMSAFTLRPTHVRHRVLWLAVIVYMITYMDRVCISHPATEISKEYDFEKGPLGQILRGFNLPYALFQIPGGWLVVRLGPRQMLAAIALGWSPFTAMTALALGKWSMYVVRFL